MQEASFPFQEARAKPEGKNPIVSSSELYLSAFELLEHQSDFPA
jgi:hypothetical protein